MTFYRLEFHQHPAEEGDRWRSKPRNICLACGLSVVPCSAEFPVPEDSMGQVHAQVWDWVDSPFLYVAGLILARADVAGAFTRSALGGFSFREAEVTMLEHADNPPLPDFRWMVIEGRCDLHDIWDRVTSTCPLCGHSRTERLAASQRRIRLRAPFPARVDVSRGREEAGGILVSDRFRHFCQAEIPGIEDVLLFSPVPVEP